MALWRVQTAEGPRLARGPVDGGPVELLVGTLDALLAAGTLEAETDGPVPAGAVLLAPVEGQEVWAAGVTYAASRTARNDESKGAHDFYDLVYDAERPELFFKAAPGRVRGPGAAIGVREDSGWDVPEPELALVISAGGRDPRLHDRQRRLVALDRGREPAVSAAGEGLQGLLRAGPVHRAGRRGGPESDSRSR